MTAEEKKQLEILVRKYINENANAACWGKDAARKLQSALSSEWLLNYRYLADPKK